MNNDLYLYIPRDVVLNYNPDIKRIKSLELCITIRKNSVIK